jgi:hypothetical protein
VSTDYPPIRLRYRPLVWHILGRRGWHRAVPFFEIAEFADIARHRNRQRLAGVDPQITPWVPGDTAERTS